MASYIITLDDIRAALKLPDFDVVTAQQPMVPATRRMYPDKNQHSRQAGVLILLYPCDDQLHFVLTRRTESLRGHSGQISFPGGKRDLTDRTLVDTALRETCEELGICDNNLSVLGQLSTIYIPPSNFEVFPSVAALDTVPAFSPNPAEVDEVFSVPVAALLDERYKQSEERTFQEQSVTIPFYSFHEQKVWGATAIMLSELEGRLRATLPDAVLETFI
jgi:8-oxo-dGTP pyrophosphatase MutT (NUDIX family)